MNKLKIVLPILIVFVFSVLIYPKLFTSNLSLISLDGVVLNEKKFIRNDILFIYFSLGCGECEELLYKITTIENKLDKKYQIVYVSNEKNKLRIIDFLKNKNINIDFSKIYFDQKNNFDDYIDLGFTINFPTLCTFDVKKNKKTIVQDIDDLY